MGPTEIVTQQRSVWTVQKKATLRHTQKAEVREKKHRVKVAQQQVDPEALVQAESDLDEQEQEQVVQEQVVQAQVVQADEAEVQVVLEQVVHEQAVQEQHLLAQLFQEQ